MDTIKIFIDGKSQPVNKRFITAIKEGKALMTTGRWYTIDCDCKDYELIEADEETHIPESHIVCNICNKTTYVEDLKP